MFGGKVTAKQVEMDGAKKAIALSGTPADCISSYRYDEGGGDAT